MKIGYSILRLVSGKGVDALPQSRLSRHVAGQLVRSGTSPAANYAEACAAESKRDFIHKLGIALRELRESRSWIKLILKQNFCLREESHRCSMKFNNFEISSASQSSQRKQINRRQRDRQILRALDILHFAFVIFTFSMASVNALKATVINGAILGISAHGVTGSSWLNRDFARQAPQHSNLVPHLSGGRSFHTFPDGNV